MAKKTPARKALAGKRISPDKTEAEEKPKKLSQKEKRTQATEEKEAHTLHETAVEALSNIDTSYIKLASSLFALKHQEYYRTYFGASNFEIYCNDIGIDYTKATRLVKMYDAMKGLKLDPDRLEALKWSKAVELMSVATPGNAKALLKKAETMTVAEFRELVKKIKGKDTGNTRATYFSIRFDASSNEGGVVNEAINQAKKMFETEDVAVAIAGALGQWLTERTEGSEVVPEQLCAVLSRAYGGVFTFVPGSVEDELSDGEEEGSDEDEGEDDESEEFDDSEEEEDDEGEEESEEE